MQKWEYMRVKRSRTVKIGLVRNEMSAWDIKINENQYGEDGWELVSIATYNNPCPVPGYTTDEMWVFKRPKDN